MRCQCSDYCQPGTGRRGSEARLQCRKQRGKKGLFFNQKMKIVSKINVLHYGEVAHKEETQMAILP